MLEEEQTCGRGLAANSPLPAKLGELITALAGVPETHMKALDLHDQNSRPEHEAYGRLARALYHAAAQLEGTAREMAGCLDLPMGRHNMESMAGPEPLAAFERYIGAKRELLGLLQETLARDEETLAMMTAPSDDG